MPTNNKIVLQLVISRVFSNLFEMFVWIFETFSVIAVKTMRIKKDVQSYALSSIYPKADFKI